MSVGFIGIGTMGLPMARRLLEAGVSLQVWNRTADRCAPLAAAGAVIADTVDEVFERCEIVLLMLLNEQAINHVLERGSPGFARRLHGRTIVVLGTTSAGFSEALETDVRSAGGRYVEAPVSGSREPAAAGELIGMLAGHEVVVDAVVPLLQPLCKQIVRCGAVPNALRLKLAINHYLILQVAALAEAFTAAEAAGVEMTMFRSVLDAGPMASTVSRGKLEKLMHRDFSAQASIRDVSKIAKLVCDQVRQADTAAPLIEIAAHLFRDAKARGLSEFDMIAVRQPGQASTESTSP